MLILPSLINRFNEVSVKFPAGFVKDIDIFKILQKGKATSIDKTILKRINLEDSHFLILRLTAYLH